MRKRSSPAPDAAASVREAARNNAEWCDAFCRSHGIVGAFDPVAWASARRTPPLYPDAVSLVPGCPVDALLSRVDARGGCSIKDSFGDLDLSASGFEVLFTSEWLCLDRPDGRDRGNEWSPVGDAEELSRWEAAWGESPERPFFRSELLTDARIRILARSERGRIRAGAVANRSGAVIGLSNVFDLDGDLESAWRDAAAVARDALGAVPVVGYDHGESLETAHRAGFETIGALAVWRA